MAKEQHTWTNRAVAHLLVLDTGTHTATQCKKKQIETEKKETPSEIRSFSKTNEAVYSQD